MWDDVFWQGEKYELQRREYKKLVKEQEKKGGTMVVVELGAGLSVPTIRFSSELFVHDEKKNVKKYLVRINPQAEFNDQMCVKLNKITSEQDLGQSGVIELEVGALEGLTQI